MKTDRRNWNIFDRQLTKKKEHIKIYSAIIRKTFFYAHLLPTYVNKNNWYSKKH